MWKPPAMGSAVGVGVTVVTALLGPQVVVAQAVEGVVRHQTSGEPLAGVLVSVLGLDGERIRGVLTNGTGGFSIEVPMGRYQLRAERIGLRTETSGAFDLATLRSVFRSVEMSERAVEIAGLVVDSRVQSCRLDPRNADRMQRWWSEIRTALDVSAALQREEFGRFLVERFEREWDDDLDDVLGSNRSFEVSVSTRPFVSAPAEELMREGFVQGELSAGRLYFGPDADVLLSSVFLAQHCFSLVEERGRLDQLGLRFEPVDGREVPEIEGTLWVDTTTAELQDLDFRYVNVDGPEAEDAGGNIVFEYLPSGAWIVSDWYIRMPRTGVRGRRNRLVTVGYYDGGGSVRPLPELERGGLGGTIRGIVRDSLRGGGLEGALVTALNTADQVTTGPDGRFEFSGLPEGTHLVTFRHEELEVWGLGPDYVEVEVRRGQPAAVELAVPPFERVARALCLASGAEAETLVVGRVLGPNRQPLRAHRLRLRYEVTSRRGGRMSDVRLRTDENGRFTLCSIPGDVEVYLDVDLRDRWEEVTVFGAPEGRLTYREIWFTR